ncbi:MAG: hypothetical protein ACKVTZ_12085, partial [Bacteroidia bacterium]
MKKITLFLFSMLALMGSSFAQAGLLTQPNVPDAYGYYWRGDTTASGPTYGWIDISTIGTQVTGLGDDNVKGPFNMGVNFKYYWNTYSQVHIGSNGYLSFSSINISSTAIGFPPTPSQNGLNDVIAAFMCDLKHDGAGNTAKVYTYTNTGTQQFIVTFEDVPYWDDASPTQYSGSNSFQFILDAKNNTITLQYKTMSGNWNASYNNTTNPVVIGIENSTGVYGRMISNLSKPDSGSAFMFYAPAVAGVNVIDASPVLVQNPENGGIFLKQNVAFALNTDIGNTGNDTITNTITALGTVKDSLGGSYFSETQTVPAGLLPGAAHAINFTNYFTPLDSTSYIYNVKTTLTGDMVGGNNNQNIEMIACAPHTGTRTRTTYATAPGLDQVVNWTGGSGNSGGGVYIKPYGYPATITDVVICMTPTQSATYVPAPTQNCYTLTVYDDDLLPVFPGAPLGAVDVFGDSVTLASTSLTWSKHHLQNPITIFEGGVYVGYIQKDSLMAMGAQKSLPISRRSYEILDNNWAVHRSNNEIDMMLGLEWDLSQAVVTPAAIDIANDVNRFEVFPNPSTGIVNMEISVAKRQNVMVKIFDATGAKVGVYTFNEVTDLTT